jgi:hypothetical protein
MLNVSSVESWQCAQDVSILDIHTCDARVVVNINRWLQDVLKQPCGLRDGEATEFDTWIHSQMVLTSYNRI